MVSTDEERLRQDICQVCRMMYERGLIGGPAGNVSARAGPERIVLTPSAPFKQLLRPKDLIAVDLDGQRLGPETDANRDRRPTSELAMHLEVYRRRPDVGAVVHGHPPHCVALSVTGLPLHPQLITEAAIVLGAVGVARYGTTGTRELSDAVGELIEAHDALVLPHHGALTVGRDVFDAYARMEVVEHVAHVEWLARQVGSVEPLPVHEVEKLLALRRRLGIDRPGDVELLRR